MRLNETFDGRDRQVMGAGNSDGEHSREVDIDGRSSGAVADYATGQPSEALMTPPTLGRA